MNLVSVVIPVYNHAHTLERSLRSLLLQTNEQDIETIIVNDGSTDNLAEVVKLIRNNPEFEKLNIRELINQENQGAPTARNRGVKEATGEYIIFWDADTIARPQMIVKMRHALELHPEASYAYSQLRYGWKKIRSNKFDPELLKKMNYIDVTSLIREIDLIPFDESLKRFQDWDLWLTMLHQNKAGIFVPEVLYKKVVQGRVGYSSWIPSFLFKLPWKMNSVKKYELSKDIILKKHGLHM